MYQLRNYSFIYKEKKIIDDANIDFIKRGHVVICGEIGTGKSTLAKSLINYNNYDGEIKYNKQDIKKMQINAITNYVTQNLEYYFINASVYDEILFATRISEFEIDTYLKKYNLFTEKYENPHNLSGGEKVRLVLLICELNKNEVIILDETIVMNDYKNLKLITAELEKRKEEYLIIEISHDYERIKKADQIIFIADQNISSFNDIAVFNLDPRVKELWETYD